MHVKYNTEQIFRPHDRPAELKTLGWGPTSCCVVCLRLYLHVLVYNSGKTKKRRAIQDKVCGGGRCVQIFHAFFRYITLLILEAPPLFPQVPPPPPSNTPPPWFWCMLASVSIIVLRRRLPTQIANQVFCHYYRFQDLCGCWLASCLKFQNHHLILEPALCAHHCGRYNEKESETLPSRLSL